MTYPSGPPKATATIAERFKHYDNHRNELLERSRTHAAYTLPRLFDSDFGDTYVPGTQDHEPLPELFWAKPGQNVTQLASRLTNSIFPPNGVPFFHFPVNKPMLEKLVAAGEITPEVADMVPQLATNAENHILETFQTSNLRSTLDSALTQVVVLPNTLVFQTDDHEFRTYRFDQFVIRRTVDGSLAEIITQDWVEQDLLDDKLRNIKGGAANHRVGHHEPLYVQITWDRNDKIWKVRREFRETVYETGEYKADVLPYYDMFYSSTVGESYGTSLVEQNFPLIRSGEETARALTEGLAAGSEGRMGVDPTGLTDIQDLVDTPNWSFVSAREQDVFALQASVGTTVSVAQAALAYYAEELDKAFMVNSAAALQGERVTAFQVGTLQNETNEGLSTVLTATADNLQRKAVLRTLYVESRKKDSPIPAEFKQLMELGVIGLEVKTGLDNIGRQFDALRLQAVAQTMLGTGHPEVAEAFKGAEWSRKLVIATGFDAKELVRTPDELTEQRQAAAQQTLGQQVADQAIQSGGRIAEQGASQ